MGVIIYLCWDHVSKSGPRKYLYLLQLSNMYAVFSSCDSGMIYVYVLLQLPILKFQKNIPRISNDYMENCCSNDVGCYCWDKMNLGESLLYHESDKQDVYWTLHMPLCIYTQTWTGSSLYLKVLEHLTHWGIVMQICLRNVIIIGSDNVLSLSWCHTIIWTNAGILLIEPFRRNLIKSPRFTGGDFMFLYRFVRRRRRKSPRFTGGDLCFCTGSYAAAAAATGCRFLFTR